MIVCVRFECLEDEEREEENTVGREGFYAQVRGRLGSGRLLAENNMLDDVISYRDNIQGVSCTSNSPYMPALVVTINERCLHYIDRYPE